MQNNPLAILDGPNTNVSNTRYEAITPATDVLECSGIIRYGINSTDGSRLYVGNYPPSYNMTAAAYHERTTNVQNGRNFEHATKLPSVYDPRGANFDVTWKQFGEPRHNFPDNQTATFDASNSNSRATRALARTAPTPTPPPQPTAIVTAAPQPLPIAPAAPFPDPEVPPQPAALYCKCNHKPGGTPPLFHTETYSSKTVASAYFCSPLSFIERAYAPPNKCPHFIPQSGTAF